MIKYLCIAALLSISAALVAGETDGQKKRAGPAPPAGFIDTASPQTADDPLNVGIPCEDISNASVQELCWHALERRFEYYVSGMDHRQQVFKWQHFSGRVIFGFVLLLVTTGIYFSYLQFRLYLRSADNAEGRLPNQDMGTDLEISSTGVKVSSNILGVIILSLSLAFFYLYLAYVYPIQEIF